MFYKDDLYEKDKRLKKKGTQHVSAMWETTLSCASLLFVCSLTWTGRRSWTWGCSEEQRSTPWEQGVERYVCCWAVLEVRRTLAPKMSHIWISLAQNSLLSFRAQVGSCSVVDQETWMLLPWNWVIHLGTAGVFQQYWWRGGWGSFTGHTPSWFLLLALTSYSYHSHSFSCCDHTVCVTSSYPYPALPHHGAAHLLPVLAKCFIFHALHMSTWDNQLVHAQWLVCRLSGPQP